MDTIDKYDQIILVDDNETTLFYNLDLINDLAPNSKVSSFENGTAFIEKYNTSLCTSSDKILLLLDISMPKKNGFEVLAELEEENENITNLDVIMVTSSNLKSDTEKATRFLNIIGYIEKPLTEQKLANTISGII